jgi:hypothetical protein
MTYEETMDSTNRICPYCGSSYQVEPEDYSEDARTEECEECGKAYIAYDVFSVYHCAVPDCELNGQTHKWEAHHLHSGGHYDFCDTCGKCNPSESDDGEDDD